MLGVATTIALSLLPSYVSAQTTATGQTPAKATCLSGYDWSFNSDNVSPCDVAASLAGVCVGGTFTLAPLDQGFVYLGPSAANANSCRCSSVYYSLLSACANCQARNFIRWSAYNANCSTVYSQVFTQPIPAGTKVPAYAYLDVQTSDDFNATLAQNTKGTESTRVQAASSSSKPSASHTAAPAKKKTNVGAIAGGVVAGVVGLILIAALIAWLVARRRKTKPAVSKPIAYEPVQQSPNMGYAPNQNSMAPYGGMASMSPAPTTMSHGAGMSPGPGMSPAPGTVYDPNDPTTFPVAEHSTGTGSYNPYPQHTGTPDHLLHQQSYQGGMAQNYTGSTNAGGRPQYTGAPEV
ncbi:hypothetical protein CPB83DRAFT_856976 [Crepidotus variabilis]|uniref:Transmembrane protein n=1 Tax=Crepidotus variabilis TaxID=179855 RepID=A0A9P6EDL4_9AGAR|nr:hypothetical protein CPB83DRAFT_856976 [Crepidotus variabilis]